MNSPSVSLMNPVQSPSQALSSPSLAAGHPVEEPTGFDLVREVALRICVVFYQTVQEISRQVVKALCFAGRNLVAMSVSALVGVVVGDRPFTSQIHALRIALNDKTNHPYWSELCRSYASYLTGYLVQTADYAEQFTKPIRPYWLYPLIQEEEVNGNLEVDYTVTGQITDTLLQNHKTLLFQTLYVNFLKLALHFATEIQNLQDKKPFLLPDLARILSQKIAKHFEIMKSSVYAGEKPELTSKELSKFVNDLLFVNGADDLILPGPDFVKVQLRDAVWQGIEAQLPGLYDLMYTYFSDPHTMEFYLLSAFTGLKGIVDGSPKASEAAKPVEVTAKPKPKGPSWAFDQNEFNQAIGAAIENFFNYIDTSVLRELSIVAKKDTISSTVGLQAKEALDALDLSDLFANLPKGLLPLLAGGKWEKSGDHDKFNMTTVTIFKTEAEYAAYLKTWDDYYVDVKTKLDKIVEELGTNGAGLKQIADQQIVRSPKMDEVQERKKPFFKRIKEMVVNEFHELGNDIKRDLAGVILKYLLKEVHHVGQEVFVKMQDKRHAALLCALPADSIRFISTTSTKLRSSQTHL